MVLLCTKIIFFTQLYYILYANKTFKMIYFNTKYNLFWFCLYLSLAIPEMYDGAQHNNGAYSRKRDEHEALRFIQSRG